MIDPKTLAELRAEKALKNLKEILIIELNADEDVMLDRAYLLNLGTGTAEGCCFETHEADGDVHLYDWAEVYADNGQTNLLLEMVTTRPSSKTKRPNGVKFGGSEQECPDHLVAFNSGGKRLTVNGEWLAPGEYSLYLTPSMDDPAVQEALMRQIKEWERRQQEEQENQDK